MLKINPHPLNGPWHEGFSLDVHTISSDCIGHDAYGHPQFRTVRSPVGELLYRLKYQSDKSAAAPLCQAAADFGKSRNWTPALVIPVPPSRPGRRFQPVPLLAKGIAHFLGCAVSADCLVKTKDTPELKSIYDHDERLQLLEGAFQADPGRIAGRSILIVDDLYRSGATMEAIANAVRVQGVSALVYALAITRTRSNR